MRREARRTISLGSRHYITVEAPPITQTHGPHFGAFFILRRNGPFFGSEGRSGRVGHCYGVWRLGGAFLNVGLCVRGLECSR